jgi:hypothetical protein
VRINGTILINALREINARCTSGGPEICSTSDKVRVCGQVSYPEGINIMIRDVGKIKREVEVLGAGDVNMNRVETENSLVLREKVRAALRRIPCNDFCSTEKLNHPPEGGPSLLQL